MEKNNIVIKQLNLINIKIIEKRDIQVEILYKTKDILSDIEIYYINNKQEKIKATSCITIYEKDIKKVKAIFNFSLQYDDILQFKLVENNIEYNANLLDNKDKDIIELSNQYIIFTKKYKLKIKPKEAIFLIEKRKIGDAFIYEYNKQKYAISKYHKLFLLRLLKFKAKYYLFNDRMMFGDDNAEQLFKYINENDTRMAKNSYFILDKNSERKESVKKIGKVLKYGTLKHKFMYLNAKMVISSHASYYDRVFNPFSEEEMDIYKDKITKQFVFLQHGVIESEVNNILNRCNILADLFVTTTNREYQDVIEDKYLYEKDMIICTGLARFDKLIDERKKYIVIAPTWRAYLTNVEYTNDKGNEFINSEFYNRYKSLLGNEALISELEKSGYKIKFLLHPVFEKYKDLFLELNNNYVEIYTANDIKYSKLFKECSLFITDYSSTQFDIAFLKKPIIYYQFDKEKYFSSHYAKGFFEYNIDGFGSVLREENEIVNKVINYLKNDCQMEDKYKERIENTFKYLDYHNSERIYKKVLELDKKKEKNYRFNNVY